MKLYTEEQVHNTIKIVQNYCDRYEDKKLQKMICKYIISLTPITLPTDEEIIKEASKTGILSSYKAFLVGAKWLKEQINKQLCSTPTTQN